MPWHGHGVEPMSGTVTGAQVRGMWRCTGRAAGDEHWSGEPGDRNKRSTMATCTARFGARLRLSLSAALLALSAFPLSALAQVDGGGEEYDDVAECDGCIRPGTSQSRDAAVGQNHFVFSSRAFSLDDSSNLNALNELVIIRSSNQINTSITPHNSDAAVFLRHDSRGWTPFAVCPHINAMTA